MLRTQRTRLNVTLTLYLAWTKRKRGGARNRLGMPKRDYYEMLGVNRDADEEAIKKAYRRLAMMHHPDRNPNNPHAEELFKEAKEAYEILTDVNKRAAYDRYGHAGVDPRAGMAGGGAGFSGFADAFGDIFGDIFNQARGGRSSVYRGADR